MLGLLGADDVSNVRADRAPTEEPAVSGVRLVGEGEPGCVLSTEPILDPLGSGRLEVELSNELRIAAANSLVVSSLGFSIRRLVERRSFVPGFGGLAEVDRGLLGARRKQKQDCQPTN
jgi:hypothetical protein